MKTSAAKPISAAAVLDFIIVRRKFDTGVKPALIAIKKVILFLHCLNPIQILQPFKISVAYSWSTPTWCIQPCNYFGSHSERNLVVAQALLEVSSVPRNDPTKNKGRPEGGKTCVSNVQEKNWCGDCRSGKNALGKKITKSNQIHNFRILLQFILLSLQMHMLSSDTERKKNVAAKKNKPR